jgi:6-pyruvoyltetrahydropterin/6-carboxytetrahydropterin synthase
MYSITVRDHIFIAHSLKGEVFGPAQNLHGATYVIDVEFKTPELDEYNMVIDIGMASQVLSQAISGLNYRNLDEHEAFQSEITTTEFLARYIHGEICKHIQPFFHGIVKITLHESHLAWGSYEAPAG